MKILFPFPLAFMAIAGVAAVSSSAQTTYTVKETSYISSHPWGGCNAIIRKEIRRGLGQKIVRYVFRRSCGRHPFKYWEQEFANVQETDGHNAIYIPKQEMIDGRVFPGNYWCIPPSAEFFRTWRIGYCTKDGFIGAKRY